MRIGYGFAAGRSKEKDDKYIVLAGEKISWRSGVFSDAETDRDVLSLAVAEALVGAMGLGSLQQCSAMEFDLKHLTGLQVVEQASRLMEEQGFALCNMDIKVLLQEIRPQPLLEQMKANLCSALGCTSGEVNLKLGKEQWLGYTGSGDGFNATAVCLIKKK